MLGMRVVLFFFALAGAMSWWQHAAESALGFSNGDDCHYTRNDALACIVDFVDANHDGEISAAEFDRAMTLYLPTQLKVAEWVLNRMGYYITLKDTMAGCDVNKDGKLTLWDWEHSAKTCLPNQADLCKLKSVCDRARGGVKEARVKT